MPYIYSTAAQSTNYPVYYQQEGSLPRIVKSIVINGGTGVIDKKTLITPLGTMTKVTDEELECLLKDSDFQSHVNRGFLIVQKSKAEAEKVVSDLVLRQVGEGDQLVPEDFAANDDVGGEEIKSVRPSKK